MRKPAVAGAFYSANEGTLKKEIEKCFFHKLGVGKLPQLKKGERKIKGMVVPHAGYMYSGPIASHSYFALAEDGFPSSFIILGPKHHWHGNAVALTTENFLTPLGEVAIDKDLANELQRGIIHNDIYAHYEEHSIEVQLPFLQFIKKDIKFVPIVIGVDDFEYAKEIGEIIKNAIKGKDVVVLASSDFTHFESQKSAEKKDKIAIDDILNLNARKLYDDIHRYDISMCGYMPTVVMLEGINGKKAELLKYGTSGDITKDYSSVVGYGSIKIE